ncbi:MAG: FecR domain-containing protein [Verrucomicrobiota bacterium]
MKPLGNFTGRLFACLTTLIMVSAVSNLQAQTMKQGEAKVRQIKGSAKYSTQGGAWVPLKLGTVLKSGATIQTAPESIVDLDLGDNGPVVRVTPSTTMSLDKLTHSGTGVDSVIETKLNLQLGTIIGNVKKLAKASKYEIKTPNGVAGIRGTDYVVTVKKRADGTYEVTFTDITGTLVVVAMVDNQPQTVVLNAGESWTPGSDVIPTPRQLLDFYQKQVADAIAAVGSGPGEGPGYFIPPPAVAVVEQYISPTIGAGEFEGDIIIPPGDGERGSLK